jgi:SAM-dependent methyltransferase
MAEWFEEWFNEDYLALYAHRDDGDAGRLVALLRRSLPWDRSWRVLDVACGPGRHARALEAVGARCFGLDLSMPLLRRARQVTGIPLIRADMRRIPVRPRSMDLTVNLFTSFGYFEDDAEHRAALEAMVGTVRPGGWFAIDFLNAERVRSALVPSEAAMLGGHAVSVTRELSGEGRFVRKTISAADGRRWQERVRLFGIGELESMLEDAGVVVSHRFGDYDGGPPAPGAPRVVLLGQVP